MAINVVRATRSHLCNQRSHPYNQRSQFDTKGGKSLTTFLFLIALREQSIDGAMRSPFK
ncbi:MAG: hypothetical protein AAF892_03585 [Cyanobacteria bacterium P01_D01_bin.71]